MVSPSHGTKAWRKPSWAIIGDQKIIDTTQHRPSIKAVSHQSLRSLAKLPHDGLLNFPPRSLNLHPISQRRPKPPLSRSQSSNKYSTSTALTSTQTSTSSHTTRSSRANTTTSRPLLRRRCIRSILQHNYTAESHETRQANRSRNRKRHETWR